MYIAGAHSSVDPAEGSCISREAYERRQLMRALQK